MKDIKPGFGVNCAAKEGWEGLPCNLTTAFIIWMLVKNDIP